ncbi:hypothetical protein Hanom_Chr01g00011701 [Helianthus anomalus]
MGCFLGCFGSSVDRKRKKQRYKVIPRDQVSFNTHPLQFCFSVYCLINKKHFLAKLCDKQCCKNRD